MEQIRNPFNLKSKTLFHLSWLTSIYYIFLALDSYLIKLRFVLIGVIRELITIPLFGAQLFLCIWLIYWYIKKDPNKKDCYMMWIFLFSLVNSLSVIISFFI